MDRRAELGEWEDRARSTLAEFRAATTALLGDRVLADLVARLIDGSPEFAQWWPQHDVAGVAASACDLSTAPAG